MTSNVVKLLIVGLYYCLHRDAVTQIAELLEIIGATEHSELVIREHTLKVNR